MYPHFFSAGIYGGFLLGVRSVNGLAFYDWENTELIRRIEIQPKHVRLGSAHCCAHIKAPHVGQACNELNYTVSVFFS